MCLAVTEAHSSSCRALLPSLCCPPHAQPRATGCSLLQVVAVQGFQHPFRPGNGEWQKELTPLKKKKNGKENRERRLSHAGTTDTQVLQKSSLPPQDQPIPWTGEGEGNQRASTSVEELSHARNLQQAQHITCVGRRNTELLGPVWLRAPLCPQFNWTPSTAGICTGAQISVSSHPLMFSVQNLFVFMCSQILHFIAAYWLFHYFIFLSWSEGVFVDFMFYYYLVAGRTSEIKQLEKCVRFWWLLNTTSLAPAKNGSTS